MSRATVLARGRAAAERGMVDSVTITRKTGVTTNDLTGAVTPTVDAIYGGKCRVQQATAQGNRTDAGEVSVIVLGLQLQLPIVGSELVARGDVVVVDACANDSSLVGRTFTVRDLHHKSEATARRLTCEEVT